MCTFALRNRGLDYFGIALFAFGFAYECISDDQKLKWNRRNKFGSCFVFVLGSGRVVVVQR